MSVIRNRRRLRELPIASALAARGASAVVRVPVVISAADIPTAEVVDVGHAAACANAFWSAGIRVREQAREAPAYEDGSAEILGGQKARQMADGSTAPAAHWDVSMRTVIIVRLILQAIAAGVTDVINLGAGLDARPSRLEIPPRIRCEADLSAIIQDKETRLAAHRPRCSLQRLAVDLAFGAARHRLLALVGQRMRRVLVLAEGLLPFLSVQEVAAIAADLHELPNVV